MQEGYENKIVDLTMEPFQYEFPAKEMIEGHKFVHMYKGIFRADPVFQISKKELISLIRIYRDLIFYGFWKEN